MKVSKYKVEKSEIVEDDIIECISKAVKEDDVDTVEQIFDKLRADMNVGEIKVFENDSTLLFIYKEEWRTEMFSNDVRCVRSGGFQCGSMQIYFNRAVDPEETYWCLIRDGVWHSM